MTEDKHARTNMLVSVNVGNDLLGFTTTKTI